MECNECGSDRQKLKFRPVGKRSEPTVHTSKDVVALVWSSKSAELKGLAGRVCVCPIPRNKKHSGQMVLFASSSPQKLSPWKNQITRIKRRHHIEKQSAKARDNLDKQSELDHTHIKACSDFYVLEETLGIQGSLQVQEIREELHHHSNRHQLNFLPTSL